MEKRTEMIHSWLESSSRIAIFTHINPDGDALGSSYGMLSFLESLGKQAWIFLPSAPGASLNFVIPDDKKDCVKIWSEDNIQEFKEIINGCDLLVGVDFNTGSRIGDFLQLLIEAKGKKILIDHHVGPEIELFDEVYSKTQTSSACELVFEVLKSMPGIDGDVKALPEATRTALMTGMTTDTNNFANSVFPSTLIMASELIAAGTDRDGIIQKLYFNYPLRRIQAEAYLMGEVMKITPDGVAYIILDKDTQLRFGLQEGDTEGFVNVPLSIAEVRLSIFLKEETDKSKVRVSLRSNSSVSARECASRYFNGGGHEQASGGKLVFGTDISDINEVASYVEKSTHEFFMVR